MAKGTDQRASVFTQAEHVREPERFQRNDARHFANRTSKNLAAIHRARDAKQDVHVVVAIVTSLLGLIVFPWEYAKRNRRVTEAKRSTTVHPQSLQRLSGEGWPLWIQDPSLETAETLGRLVFHLRNALSHRRIEFLSDSPDPREVTINFEDYRRDGTLYWSASINAAQLERFVSKLSAFLVNEAII